jgi:ectoine hydroxylase-related dioxygenase (phytanoyl-CoA dioxygenase family)
MTVTVWLAIDDVDSTNSPLEFIPGSHRRGAIEYVKAEGAAVLSQEVEDVARFGEPITNVLSAGQISIHTSTLLHGSEPNRSDRRRCGLALRYIPSSCGAVKGAERVLNLGIPCRGELGQWRRNEPPIGDDLTPLHRHYRD